mgnify:CR=1 FL=1
MKYRRKQFFQVQSSKNKLVLEGDAGEMKWVDIWNDVLGAFKRAAGDSFYYGLWEGYQEGISYTVGAQAVLVTVQIPASANTTSNNLEWRTDTDLNKLELSAQWPADGNTGLVSRQVLPGFLAVTVFPSLTQIVVYPNWSLQQVNGQVDSSIPIPWWGGGG